MVKGNGDRPVVGVLALQGDFSAHSERLAQIGADPREVRTAADLDGLDALVIPGGESTTLLNFLEGSPLEGEIRNFSRSGRPVFGTCAGAILLAAEVSGPAQRSLGLLDIGIERNAYGRQVDSFVTRADCPALGGEPLEMVFIRAPVIRRVGSGVQVLAGLDGHPVLVRQGALLASTFHPEMTPDPRVHRYFVEMIAGHRGGPAQPEIDP